MARIPTRGLKSATDEGLVRKRRAKCWGRVCSKILLVRASCCANRTEVINLERVKSSRMWRKTIAVANMMTRMAGMR